MCNFITVKGVFYVNYQLKVFLQSSLSLVDHELDWLIWTCNQLKQIFEARSLVYIWLYLLLGVALIFNYDSIHEPGERKGCHNFLFDPWFSQIEVFCKKLKPQFFLILNLRHLFFLIRTPPGYDQAHVCWHRISLKNNFFINYT